MDEATYPGEVVSKMNQTAYEKEIKQPSNTEHNWFLNQTIKDFTKETIMGQKICKWLHLLRNARRK